MSSWLNLKMKNLQVWRTDCSLLVLKWFLGIFLPFTVIGAGPEIVSQCEYVPCGWAVNMWVWQEK